MLRPAGLLRNARVALSPRRAERLDILVENGRIRRLLAPSAKSSIEQGEVLNLEGCLVLPGLINAHDHLEFSLFLKLGSGPYPNARAWAEEVYHPDDSPIAEHLCVPKRERLIWGAIKNLLGGVTTVCHHNPYEAVFDDIFPVRVVKHFGWAHSLPFSNDIEDRFRKTPPDEPFIIHVAEGTDEESGEEIFRLAEMGVISERTVCVHGVALDEEGLSLVQRKGASIVWCPSSNLFTLGKTLALGLFHRPIPVALGTDSAITAPVTVLEEIKVALKAGGLSNERVYNMVTQSAAWVLRLSSREGSLVENGVADLLVLQDTGGPPCDTLVRATTQEVQLIMVGGEIKLASDGFKARLARATGTEMQPISFEKLGRLWIQADIASLIKTTREALGKGNTIRLAGRLVEA